MHDKFGKLRHLVILGGQFIKAFLNHVIAIQILDQHNNMKTECDNNRMNLSIISMVSLLFSCQCDRQYLIINRLASRLVDKKSIIF